VSPYINDDIFDDDDLPYDDFDEPEYFEEEELEDDEDDDLYDEYPDDDDVDDYPDFENEPASMLDIDDICPECDGEGMHNGHMCKSCQGTGER
jgi:hypothetical protein